jgi:cytochrome b subunit of formate dehydrogenase
MDTKKTRKTILLILLGINVVSTILHYTDNFVHFDKYPQPAWITPEGVYISWIVLTLFGIAGYFLYVKNAFWAAYLCLVIYAITGISSSAHYFFPATEVISLKMNVLIWLDAIAGTSILCFTLWSALLQREWQGDRERLKAEG